MNGERAPGARLVRFAQSLFSASSLEQLERGFLAGFGRVMGVPVYGYDLVDPTTDRPRCIAAANVSDTFVARYEREARDVDSVLAEALATGRPAYNLDMMSPEEWEESPAYRRAYRMHRIRHVVEVPVMNAGRILGNLHFATSDPEHDFGPIEIREAEAIGGVLGVTIDGIESRERVEQERDQGLAALGLAGTAVMVTDPATGELRPNDVARSLLQDVVEVEECLHQLLARPITDGGFSRRMEVELATGEVAVLHADSSPMPHESAGLVTVLELQREQAGISSGAVATLTPREAQVAALVVDGLADREIAEKLHLSHHTVSQYVNRIYRKLDVDSRVTLTRLLLGAGGSVRRN